MALLIQSMSANSEPVIILLEPDQDDRLIAESFFRENGYPTKLEFVENGHELFQYLGDKLQKNIALPVLVMLTIFPGAPAESMGILQQLKANGSYSHIPVVMLTGSMNSSLAKQYYAAGATSVIEKPSGSTATSEKIDSFIRYWFQTVGLQ